MLLVEELACDEREEELLEDGITGVLDELRLVVVAVLDVPLPIIPKGDGWALQVERDTQLVPFS